MGLGKDRRLLLDSIANLAIGIWNRGIEWIRWRSGLSCCRDYHFGVCAIGPSACIICLLGSFILEQLSVTLPSILGFGTCCMSWLGSCFRPKLMTCCVDNNVLIRSGEARLVGWSRYMLYSGFDILPRSVVWSACLNGRSDNTDVIRLENENTTISNHAGIFVWLFQ